MNQNVMAWILMTMAVSASFGTMTYFAGKEQMKRTVS